MRKKILLASDVTNDTISFLRTVGPFAKMDIECSIAPPGIQWTYDWSVFQGFDILFISMPWSERSRRAVERAKLMGIKVWLDFDDNFLECDPSSPVYSRIVQGRDVAKECLAAADFVTVGSRPILDLIKPLYHGPLMYIPNALDDALIRFRKRYQHNNKVFWRGGNGHIGDVIYYIDEMNKALREKTVRFFGDLNPFALPFHFERESVPVLNQHDYIRAICDYNASFCVVPLRDSPFNQCKSFMGWLDATIAGSVCLTSNHEENRRPGAVLYDPGNRTDFLRELDTMLGRDASDNARRVDAAWDYILENLVLSKVNIHRQMVIEGL
jgi:hypothetical protein